jgi:hypothetical protein
MSVLQNFIDEVESWVGTPYFTEGCTKGPKGGTNCGHWLVAAITSTIPNSEAVLEGYEWSHIRYFKTCTDIMPAIIEKVAVEITLDEITVGDVTFTTYRRIASIPAVYVGDGMYVYCNVSQRQIVKMPLLENYLNKLSHVYRFKYFMEGH